ncbi:MAG: DNA polymerase I [Weeksellaceae bacterium]|nr:DNA polymerase I [Weeksellaceae bacterium]
MSKRLFLLDAYALIFRGYYAFIKNPRVNSKGFNTSAILGFMNSLLDVINKEQPTHLAVVFDVGSDSTLRHDYYPEYKANRDETPEPIQAAVPHIQEILQAMQIPVLYAQGYEADDVIGTLAKQAEKEGFTTFLVTPDKDFAQLVTENIKVYKPSSRGNGIEIWGINEVKEKFGVDHPEQVIDFLGMCGDSVDNIPGIPKVGPKTASNYIKKYGSLEGLYENLDQITGKIKESIEQNRDTAFLSKKLATILTDAPIQFDQNLFTVDQPDFEKITEKFKELEFRRLLENIYRVYGATPAQDESLTVATQLDLFSAQEAGADTSQDQDSSPWKTLDTVPHFYQSISSPTGIKLLVQQMLQLPEVSIDTETTSLNELEAELVGISFTYNSGKGYYIPFPADKAQATEIIEILKPVLESTSIVKIGQNLKYDIKVLRKYGIELAAPIYDTMVAHYVINPDMRHGLDVLAESYLHYKPISIESLIGKKGKNQTSFADVPLDQQTSYAVEDTDIAYQLKQHFEPLIAESNSQKLLQEVEFPLVHVLADMELTGITLDTSALNTISQELENDLATLEKNIYSDAQQEFNINSPKQLGEILFEQLQLDKKPKKTRTGQYATSEDILTKLRDKHPIIPHILDYRQLQKLKSTYVDALPNEVNPQTGRVHTSFQQTVAATGRLASSNPNLQNIPIRTERGREVRKAFIAKDTDHVLLAADYSQIELRLIAGLSQDPAMLESFQQNQDIHSATAARVFDIPQADVTREQRSQAKTVNFGIIYGVSAFGLSEQAGISRAEAKDLIDAYYATYPTLRDYMQNQVALARKQGYVETILGRRRYLRDINSANHVVRSQAERNAINAPIQGSAADIIKVAMIHIQQKLKDQFQTKMLLQVHDELVFEVPKGELSTVQPLIVDTMQTAVPFNVPLVVEAGVGNNWLEAH